MIADGWRIASPSEYPGYESYPPGTVLIASTADSFFSWLVMYFTDSVASHIAMFAGDGIIHDTTTSGSLNHPFADYFDGKSYLKLIKPPPPLDEKPGEIRAHLLSRPWVPYGWHKVFAMFIDYVTAGRRDGFRWRYYIDISLLLVLLGFVPLPFSTLPLIGIAGIWSLYTVIVLKNLLRQHSPPL